MAGGGPERLEGLVRAYREAITYAKPVSKQVHNRVSTSTVAFCADSRTQAQERGAELIDWYRRQQTLRNARVWSEQEASSVPADYQWHCERSTAPDPSRRDDTSSLDQIKAGRFCIGDPDDCIRYLEGFFAAGVDEIMPLFQVGPITHTEVMNTLRLFGKHVVPYFEEAERKARTFAAGS
jgi:alkanesulfonate monooxygenase SsuD/methylene tetrahydromethanopterin reductase-like flavin-dependent oxidoreductase (luciferase family)